MKKILSALLRALLVCGIATGCVKGSENGDGNGGFSIIPKKAYHQNPLTGFEQGSDYKSGQRPVAIMVNNIMSGDSAQSAWPQKGLSDADMVYEMETEGGITRYMAVYRDWEKIPVVGPIRSARDQFVQLMIPMNCLYVHDGASIYAKKMLERYNYSDKDLIPALGISFRDSSLLATKAREHTEFTSGELITRAVEDESNGISTNYTEPANVFDWVPYDEPARTLSGIDVNEVYWNFSKSYAAKLTYNRENNTYTKEHINLMSNFSHPMVDGNNDNRPVEFDNAFVLWTTIERYPDGILSNVNLSWGGIGYYFNGGKVEKVRWLKGEPNEPLRIVSLDGTETDIKINPGKSYVAIVSLDYFGTYSFDGQVVDSSGDYTPVEEIEAEEGQEATEE